jgi:lambda family phage tail tape measure protein
MAKQIEDIIVRLGLEKFEGLDKIRGSFRDLSKVTKMSEQDIIGARNSIFEFAKTAGNSEAVTKGLVSALQGLRSQADFCGDAYRSLADDIRRVGEVQRGATDALMAQRNALVATFSETTRNVRVLEEHRAALVRIQEQTRANSRAYDTLSSDIAQIAERITAVTTVARELNVALSRAFPATAAGVRATLTSINAGIELQRQVINEIDLRSGRERRLATTIEERATAEQRLNRALTAQRQLTFGESVRSGREAVRTAAAAFNETTLTTGFYSAERIGQRMGDLPNTTAGLNQELAELSERLVNTTRGSSTYVDVALRMAEIQRQLRTDILGTADAFRQLNIAESGVRRREGKLAGIQEYYATQGPLAPGVGGYRDPNTGAMIAAGAYTPGRIRVDEAAYARPIGPQPFPEAATQALQSVESAQRSVTDIYERAFIQRTELQAKYNQIYIDKALEGLELEGQLRKKEFDTQLADFDRRMGIADKRRGRRLSGMQLAQGVGAALSGGIFGGPEGLIGGLGGLAVGGVGGAFAGAAFGAQVGMFRQQLGTVTDYSARIDKLQIALRGIVGSQDAYSQALAAAASVTRDLNIPQEVAIQGMTRLSAAVKGAGGTVSDSAFAFRAVSEAVKATGGNAEQADGALLALTQVFSKGKVSAEELNQIAERLPGTFTLFAKAAGMTGPQLQKALQEGQVGLNDLMKFLQLISTEYGQTALKIAASSQEAGARLTVAMQNMQLEVGRALQPIGASLQSAFAEFITTITPSVVAALKGIAAAFEFLIENKTASGLATFALQLGAVTLGLIGLKAALEGLATIKVLALLTSTASAVKITGDVAATSALSVRGLSAALAAVPGFGWVTAGTAALGLLGAALYDNNKEFKTWVDSLLYIIKTDFESAWRLAVDIVKTNVKVITDTWEAAKNILTNTAGALVTSFDSTFNGIFSGILKRWQSLPEPLRKAMAQGGAQTIGTVLAPGNPVIGRLIGTGIRATQERPPVALADTGRYVPASAQQRFPGQLPIFPSPATDEEKKKKAAKDKADRERQAAAAEQQRLANTLLDQQLRAADRVFQHQIELDRQRYELQKRLDDAQAQNRILRETGAARDIVSNFEDLQRSLREIEERRVRAAQDVRLAKQTQQSAAVRATFDAQGAAMLRGTTGVIARTGSTGQSTGPHLDARWADGRRITAADADRYLSVNGRTPSSYGVTSPYGPRSLFGRNFHAGIDFGTPSGSGITLKNGATLLRDLGFTGAGGYAVEINTKDGPMRLLHLQRGSARMPTGAAAQQNRAIRASGGAVIEGLDVTQAEAQQQLIEANVSKERAALFEQFTLKATDALRQQNATMRDSNELQTLRNRLTLEGVRPEFIDLEERLLGLRKEQSQEQTTYNQLVKDNPDRKDELQRALAAQNEQYAERARLLRENAEAAEAFNKAMRTRQDDRIGLGLREGAEAYVQSIGTMREATTQLAQTGIKGVEDAIFSLVTTGTANFQEFAASILRDTARMIIQQLILRSIMQIIGAVAPGGGSFGKGYFDPITGKGAAGPNFGFAMGGAFAKNGIVPFAMGGIVNKPTLFKFANGGAGRLGLMGEAGPEAIMPLRRLPSGRLGVESAGSGGNSVQVDNITINVENSGEQLSPAAQKQIAGQVRGIVLATLVDQRRGGGVLR